MSMLLDDIVAKRVTPRDRLTEQITMPLDPEEAFEVKREQWGMRNAAAMARLEKGGHEHLAKPVAR